MLATTALQTTRLLLVEDNCLVQPRCSEPDLSNVESCGARSIPELAKTGLLLRNIAKQAVLIYFRQR